MRDSHLTDALRRSSCLFAVALLAPATLAAAPPMPPSCCPSPSPTTAHANEPAAPRTDLATLGPDAALWLEHVQTLTNPLFEGRVPGTRGGALTEEYLEFFFREYGLAPAFEEGAGDGAGYRQRLRIEGAPLDGYATAGALTIAGRSLAPGEDFVVTANSPVGEAAAPVTFVGYGIESGPDGFDSFGEAADLTGRIALLLRLEPLDEDGSPRWGDAPGTHSSLVTKFLAVTARGAAGILLVNPPGAAVALEGLDPLPPQTGVGCGARTRLPTAMITAEVADRLVQTAGPRGRDLMTLRRLADAGEAGAIDFDDEVRVTLRTEVRRESLDTANVAAILPGRGDLADRWIVIGAHHDHVGRGLGGVHPGNEDKLHAGADDNASGVAAVLLLARRLAARYADAPEHADLQSILFVGFAGEETGLNGSRHFADHPPVPLDRVTVMVNLDMVGRLRDGTLFVQGLNTAAELPSLLEPIFDRSDLNVVLQSAITGSDHVSFLEAGVPVLYAMTGGHAELHTPGDRAATMNPRGAVRVADLVEEVLLEMASRPGPLSFIPQESGGPVVCPAPGAGASTPTTSPCGKETP